MVRLNPNRSIAVAGGGISGITTAILLQVLGYETVLYAKALPDYGPDGSRPPEFATLHAAASVLPHSVSSPRVAHWTSISQEFFRALGFRGSCGVRNQVHYEIFEDPIPAVPPYAGSVENFEILTPEELKQPWVPKRSGAHEIHGWKFDAFFCEAPEYVRYLFSLYPAIGGRVRQPPGDGSLAAYLALDHDVYVNCTGIGSGDFLASADRDTRWTDEPLAPDFAPPDFAPPRFEPIVDPFPPKLIRGHYLRLAIGEIPDWHRGRFFSYNYKPLAEIYRGTGGLPADVYCYPRSDAWLLGGSRQEGRLDADGNWLGEQTVGEQIEFSRPDGPPLAVPSAILRLNADILMTVSNGRLDLERLVRDDPSIVSPGVGYRFVRDSESDSVRVSCSRLQCSNEPKYILHNYGHGGSGFTLSWGCAFDISRLLERTVGLTPRPAERMKFAIGHDATGRLLSDVAARLLSRAG